MTKGTGQALWLCKCDCGNIVTAYSYALRKGITTSCGCARYGNPVSISERTKLNKFRTYRASAKNRGLEFTLSVENVSCLVSQPCYYCGSLPGEGIGQGIDGSKPATNGIDRKDNYRGYTIDNAVTCCIQCNRAKMANDYDAYIQWIVRTFNHLLKTGVINERCSSD